MRRILFVCALSLALQLATDQRAAAQTFSVENTSLDVVGGIPPGDDILAPSLAAGTPPGLVLSGISATGLLIDVDGFAFGRGFDFDPATDVIDFSVDAFASGFPASGSGVDIELTAGGSGEQNYDVYRTLGTAPGTNVQIHDGNGVGPGGTVAPLGMSEPQVVLPNPVHPGVDGYEARSIPGPNIYWSWESRVNPAPAGSISGADVMISLGAPGYDGAGAVFASSVSLGLDAAGLGSDDIDALEVFDVGQVGAFEPGIDLILFSLDPNSPALGAMGLSPGDILASSGGGSFVVAVPFAALGLNPSDNLTALSVEPEGGLAVQIVSLAAASSGGHMTVQWATASEDNNAGFAVQASKGRSESVGSTAVEWMELAFVEGHGTTSERQSYTYRAEDLEPGSWIFRLKQVDYDGTTTLSNIVEATVELPDRYVMKAAYPNPFNPSTTVKFAVASDQRVSASLYNVLGTEVRFYGDLSVPANEMQDLHIDASGLPSGIYLVRLTGEFFTASQRVMLLK